MQILLTEMFKLKFVESSSIVHEVFQIDDSNNYNTRRFKPGNPKTYCGTKTVSVLGTKLWIILPDKYKNLTNLKEFKTKIKKNWVPQNCPRHLCKTYKMLALFCFI